MYISPVWMTPMAASSAQLRQSVGNAVKLAKGASMRMPTVTWISAMRCGGTPFSFLATIAAIA